MQSLNRTEMIFVRNFEKTFYLGLFRKPSVAASGISFEVEKGEVFGFLGPNGAGKTTTIKALLGLIGPDAGELRIAGHSVESGAWRRRIGYMPEHPTFYDYLTGLEMVTWFARLAGMNRIDAQKAATRVLNRVGLGHAMDRRIRGYSKGMVQRAGLAQAIVGDPDLLILDEPMTGLDPIGRLEIRELLLSLKAEGKTVFYSTHILPDVELTCDRVAIINKGSTVRVGRLHEILEATARGVHVVLSNVTNEVVDKYASDARASKMKGDRLEIFFEDHETAWQEVQRLIPAGVVLERMEPHHDDLESIFINSLGAQDAQS
jgi:ABC-2 type transport system ATP-binding protein